MTWTRRATTLTLKPSALRLIWADVQAARSLGNHRRVQMETRRGTRFDLNRASEVLGEAFADYPWTRWTVDPEDHVRRVTALQRLALQHYGLPFGHVWVCAVDGVVHSVAVWMDSAVDVPSTVDEELLPLVVTLEGSRHDASLAAEHDVHDWRPDRRHYYLGAIGTTPALQGRGLGSRRVDADAEVGRRRRCVRLPRNFVCVERRVLFEARLRGGRPSQDQRRRS